MQQIGDKAPRFRVPALIQGAMTYIDSALFQGRWVALCFPPSLGLIESVFLDRQSEAFSKADATLLATIPDTPTLLSSWCSQFGKLRVPLLADPLGRLRRSYGMARTSRAARCQTFLIDPAGLFRFHLVHDLNGRGMAAILEIVGASQRPDTRCSVGSRHRSAGLSSQAQTPVLATQPSAHRGDR
ncbi:MAG: redoxin domain-containing protein [Nitrospirota bacterium]